MKKEYETPEITIIEFEIEDAITTSTNIDPSIFDIPTETPDPGWVPGWF